MKWAPYVTHRTYEKNARILELGRNSVVEADPLEDLGTDGLVILNLISRIMMVRCEHGHETWGFICKEICFRLTDDLLGPWPMELVSLTPLLKGLYIW